MREICTGYGSHSVLWIDDDILPRENSINKNENFIYVRFIYHQCYQKNVKFVLKESSKLAWAYVRSDFFKKSLEVAKDFKLVSDVVRKNEEGGEEN